jgi:hypothetical protein
MSDPTPTDVPQLVATVTLTPLADTVRELRAEVSALRLDVQRITEERDRALAQSAAEAKQFQEAAEMAGALAEAEADRDAQVREAFMAGRAALLQEDGWDFVRAAGRPISHDDEAFAAYLRERQDGKEHAK